MDVSSRKLHAAILPLNCQPSYPDITLIDLPLDYVRRLELHGSTTEVDVIPANIRQQSTVDIIEIKYTYDLLIHERVADAVAQHEKLQQNLLDAGWGTVHIHAFIIGSAGTIRSECHTILNTCGITDTEQREGILKKLAVHSVRSTAAIVRARLTHKNQDSETTEHSRHTLPDNPPRPPRDPSENSSTATSHQDMTDATVTKSNKPRTPGVNEVSTTETDETKSEKGNHFLTTIPGPKAPETECTLTQDGPRRGSRKRKASQRVRDMDQNTRRALYPDIATNANHKPDEFTADTAIILESDIPPTLLAAPLRGHTQGHTVGTPPTDTHPHNHEGNTYLNIPRQTIPGNNRKEGSKRRATSNPNGKLPRRKKTKRKPPAAHTRRNLTQNETQLEYTLTHPGITHPIRTPSKDQHHQHKRRAVHPLDHQSSLKRVKLGLPLTSPVVPDYQSSHPRDQPDTPFDRG